MTTDPRSERLTGRVPTLRERIDRSRMLRRRAIAVAILAAVVVTGVLFLREPSPPPPSDVAGSQEWARKYYGNPDSSDYRARNIIEIEFLGEPMYVNKKVQRHFFRLAAIFQARAPEYAATIATGETDDWSYWNRDIRGSTSKSTHAFGIAIDINALENLLGTTGNIPEEVVRQWEIEGGEWGGDWSRPDPMHFESHLTPAEIRRRYHPDGSPRDWYLEELTGG